MTIPNHFKRLRGPVVSARLSLTLATILMGCALQCWSADGGGLFPVSVDGKYGYIDSTGKVAISPRYSYGWEFKNGFAPVEVGSRSRGYAQGFIDATGKAVTAAKYANVGYFSDGLAPVGLKTRKTHACFHCDLNLKWGYVGRNGRYAIRPQFHDAREFSERLAAVQDEKSRLWGYIRTDGSVAVPPQFAKAKHFSDGLACALSGKRFGYIDQSGRMVIEPRFSGCGPFSDGLALVRLDGEASSIPGPPPGRFGYVDRTGRVVFEFQADWAGNFSEGLAPFNVVIEGVLRSGYHDKTGFAAIKPQFSMAEQFTEGLALVLSNGWAFIDKTGRIAFRVDADLVDGFQNGLARVTVGKDFDTQKWGYLERTGGCVWNPSR
jgi:hypothetical protein